MRFSSSDLVNPRRDHFRQNEHGFVGNDGVGSPTGSSRTSLTKGFRYGYVHMNNRSPAAPSCFYHQIVKFLLICNNQA